ncbi:MAG: hypothetical protein FIB07_05375 [Candidatus Methanoperedens sp.]|nr:hypothetical protein [Candidatus Methanoperedens sp.]
MVDLSKQAEPAVQKLLKSDEEQLYEKLGIRAKAIAQDPTKGSSFEPQVTYDKAQMGLKEDVMEFGQRLFNRLDLEAYKLICGSETEDTNDRKDLIKAFSTNDEATIAAALSALLVTNLGLAPAIAAVVAVILVKRFFRPVYEEFCQTWKKNLPTV